MKDILRRYISLQKVSSVPEEFQRDDRGVSVVVDAALGILILLTLSTVLISGISTVGDSRAEAATEQELERISEEVASSLVAAETAANKSETYESRANVDGEARVQTRMDLPPRVSGSSYTIRISPSTTEPHEVTVTAQRGDFEQSTTITLSRDVPTGFGGSARTLQVTVTDGEIRIDGQG